MPVTLPVKKKVLKKQLLWFSFTSNKLLNKLNKLNELDKGRVRVWLGKHLPAY